MGLAQAVEIAIGELSGVRSYTGESGTRQIRARCPFHDDRRPSFGINADSGTWNCLAGCGGGWIDSLLLRLGFSQQHVAELLEGVARRPRPDKLRRKLREQRQKVSPSGICLPEEVLSMFPGCPRRMLDEGWTEDLLYRFEIGFDYDQERIVYPIRGWDGRLQVISGRSLYNQWPKYKFYGEDDLHDYAPEGYHPFRSRIVYNIHRAVLVTGKKQRIPICEGFKEVMRLDQAGITGVALAGAKFSKHQVSMLNSLVYTTGCTLVVMLDNDTTGQQQARDLCRKLARFTVPRITFTDDSAKDVSEITSLATLRRLVRDAPTWPQFVARQKKEEIHGLSQHQQAFSRAGNSK